MSVRRALICVHDTTGLVEFAKGLVARGVSLVAMGDAERELRDAGVEVAEVEQHIGAPVLVGGGSVKAMSPQLRDAILWGGTEDDDPTSEGFDIIVLNLEPFEKTSSRRDSRENQIIDAIDVDGPSILRTAARNFERVLVISDPEVYPIVLDELDTSRGNPSYEFRKLLASRAFDSTAHYELAVANWFSEVEDFPTYLLRDYVKMTDLPYGENPHQRAAYYVEVGARRHLLSMVEQIQGRELTYNNLGDLNTARQLVGDFSIPACAIVKHAAPSGCAVSGDVAGAFERAFACDGPSAYGGVISMNRTVDAATATAVVDHYFEVLFAPAFTGEALKILADRDDLRVLLDGERRKRSPGERDMRRVVGGMLVQDADSDLEDRNLMDVVTKTHPSERQWGDLLFAWRVAKWVPSNAVVLATDLTTVGIGGGKPSRDDSMNYALSKAGDRSRGSMLASDAFLMYDDAPQHAIEAGIAGIIQPGGSRRDDEIIALADAAGIPMVFTHRRHFRH